MIARRVVDVGRIVARTPVAATFAEPRTRLYKTHNLCGRSDLPIMVR